MESSMATVLRLAFVVATACQTVAFLNIDGFPDQETVDIICGDRVHLLNENGTDADECIFGTNADEVLYGNGGDDVIFGLGGDDYLVGGAGNDTLYGGSGDDVVFAGLSEDTVYGEDGDDTLYGGPNDDHIFGGSGVDVIFGGLGNDMLQGQSGGDTVYAGVGADMLYGQLGDDTLYGEGGVDNFVGGKGINTLFVDLSEKIQSNFIGEDIIVSDQINSLENMVMELKATVNTILADRTVLKSEIKTLKESVDALQEQLDATSDKLDECIASSSTPTAVSGTVVDIVYEEFTTSQPIPFAINAMPGATSLHCSLTFLSFFGNTQGIKDCNLVQINNTTWQFSESGGASVQCRAVCANFFQI